MNTRDKILNHLETHSHASLAELRRIPNSNRDTVAITIKEMVQAGDVEFYIAKNRAKRYRLTQYALEHCDKVAALRKLENDIKPKVMQVLATFAFADYSRSAASTRTCDCCGGNKFVDAEVMTMKSIGQPYLEERKETVSVLCHKCKGKGVLTNACQCKGKGVVVDEEKTILQGGVPAYKTCGRCNGRGYARLLPDAVRKCICATVIDVPETTWRRSYKDFFESLVGECIKQEEYANQMLSKVTR
ncbi:antitermination protein [Enterobacter kobei]|uniref:antitermination protein Q n=1 Tax=Enterobacter kobei TaxID=208224 RepID=UPI001F2B9028|nr:antitermination protein [Enterobacter kobei]